VTIRVSLKRFSKGESDERTTTKQCLVRPLGQVPSGRVRYSGNRGVGALGVGFSMGNAALKPYALHVINTKNNEIFPSNFLHVIAEYFLIL
jgi:hypothetical protein